MMMRIQAFTRAAKPPPPTQMMACREISSRIFVHDRDDRRRRSAASQHEFLLAYRFIEPLARHAFAKIAAWLT